MKVMIFEPFSGGHHTKYLSILLPQLLCLKRAGKVHEIVVTTSSKHYASAAFDDRLKRYEGDVAFDIVDGDFRTAPGSTVTRCFLSAVRRNRPDFLIVTSANNGALTLAIASRFFASDRKRMTSVGIIHNGYSAPTKGLKHTIRDRIHRLSRRFAPWSETYVVNPVLFRHILEQGKWAQKRVRLLPDPVAEPTVMEKGAARRLLQIPEDGVYIAMVGQSDGRKAIPELLQAFRAAAFPSNVRLLIAGSVYEPYRYLLQGEYQDLIDSQRIIVIDRYLHPEHLSAANFAADVVAVTYYTDELSSNLLAATAARRPVIGSEIGYSGMMIDTFELGWKVDIANTSSFVEALRSAANDAPTFEPSVKSARLLEYHCPTNFVHTLLRSLYAKVDLPAPPQRTWAWINEVSANPSPMS
jgi:glycosyltransferase involved in cell wall biosynthesis